MPVLFVHGHGSGPEIEDTWEDLVEKYLVEYKGYAFQGDLYEGSARRLATRSLSAKSTFLFHYYRTEKNDTWGDPPGRIGGIQKSHTKHNILVKANPIYNIEYDYSRPSYARRLATAVDNVLRATGASKVMLVGHSMGGLVSRAYVKWEGGEDKVYKILTVGTPNGGFPEGYRRYFHALKRPPWQWNGEVEEMFNGGWFEGRSYTDWLNDNWSSFCKSHGIHYATIRGTYDPFFWDGVGGDGVVEQNSAILHGAEFNAAGYVCHNKNFHLGGQQEDILSMDKSVYTANIIKEWIFDIPSEEQPAPVPEEQLTPISLETTGLKVEGDKVTIEWDDVEEGIEEIAGFLCLLNDVFVRIPASANSITYEDQPDGNYTFTVSAYDSEENLLGTTSRQVSIDYNRNPQDVLPLPVNQWVQRDVPGWFKLEITQPGYLDLTLSIPGGGRDLDLYLFTADDLSGPLTSSSTYSTRESVHKSLDPGTYYVEIREWGDSPPQNEYALQAEFRVEPSGVESSPAPVAVSPVVEGGAQIRIRIDLGESRGEAIFQLPELTSVPESYAPDFISTFRASDPLNALVELIRQEGPQPFLDPDAHVYQSFSELYLDLQDNARENPESGEYTVLDLEDFNQGGGWWEPSWRKTTNSAPQKAGSTTPA